MSGFRRSDGRWANPFPLACPICGSVFTNPVGTSVPSAVSLPEEAVPASSLLEEVAPTSSFLPDEMASPPPMPLLATKSSWLMRGVRGGGGVGCWRKRTWEMEMKSILVKSK